jgi:nucleoside-diphosphate-sugar epimerase
VVGTQNICEAVARLDNAVGLVQAGTWHTIGEMGLEGVVDEEFGYRPDKVEERAKIYALSKVCQESVMRLYSHMYPNKSYVVLRTGTILGPGMPELTAASIFIRNALSGKPLTPYKHSMYRPMLFVDIEDVCKAYEVVVGKVLEGSLRGVNNVFNIVYPEPVTVIELAEYIKQIVYEETGDRINPSIEIVDKGLPSAFIPEDKHRFQVKIDRIREPLSGYVLKHPKETLRKILYDIAVKEGMAPFQNVIAASFLSARIPIEGRVLDAGYGTGLFGVVFKGIRRLNAPTLIGCDIAAILRICLSGIRCVAV